MLKNIFNIFNAEKIANIIKDSIISDLKKEFDNFRSEISGQLEGFKLALNSIENRMNSIENRMNSIENRMNNVEDRIDRLRVELNDKIDKLRNELDSKIDKVDTKIDKVSNELDGKINSLRTELITLINDTRNEILKKVFENTQRIDELNRRIDSIYVSVGEAVNYKQLVDDLLIRMQRMETKLDQAYINEILNLIKLYKEEKK
ncbi:MAG: hypothetical protein N2485_00910 [bacterium]|nr:hypothetical protein [bacterium]